MQEVAITKSLQDVDFMAPSDMKEKASPYLMENCLNVLLASIIKIAISHKTKRSSLGA